MVPHTPGPRLPLAYLKGELWTELRHPAAYRLMRHPDTTLGEHLLYVPEAHGEAQVSHTACAITAPAKR